MQKHYGRVTYGVRTLPMQFKRGRDRLTHEANKRRRAKNKRQRQARLIQQHARKTGHKR